MNAVIYARYSSDNQREESIDAQVRACREYAATHDYNIIDVYTDEAVSGKAVRPPREPHIKKCFVTAKKERFKLSSFISMTG